MLRESGKRVEETSYEEETRKRSKAHKTHMAVDLYTKILV